MKLQEAIILAGGFGTRLKEVVSDVPKVMAPVNGRPFLEYILDYLEKNIFTHVVLSVGYKHEIIREHFKDKYKSINIDYAIEEEPLGTGGAIQLAFQKINGFRAMVFNGDTMFRVDMDKIVNFHFSKSASFSVVLREVENVERYGAVEINIDNKIIGFSEKGKKTGTGMINGGVYVIDKRFFEVVDFPGKFSIEKDGFEKLFESYPFYGILCKQYFIDIGVPDDYKRAQDEFKEFEY
jgi:D-glycero-alpha-D-manno-heptose 1-phosphate guanylyltransferase